MSILPDVVGTDMLVAITLVTEFIVIDLSNTQLYDRQAVRLAEAFRGMPKLIGKLIELRLSHNPRMGDAGLSTVVKSLSTNRVPLQNLHIYNAGAGAQTLQELGRWIQAEPHAVILKLIEINPIHATGQLPKLLLCDQELCQWATRVQACCCANMALNSLGAEDMQLVCTWLLSPAGNAIRSLGTYLYPYT